MKKILYLLLLLPLLSGCSGRSNSDKTQGVQYSRLLSILPADGYTKVEVRTDTAGTPVAIYLLVDRDAPVPNSLPKGEIIKVPVQGLVVNSSVYAAPIEELGALGCITGVLDAQYFSMPSIKQGLASGKIKDMGNSQSPTVEKIVELAPDGIMINLYEGMNTATLPTVGVPYIKMADNLETSPLGRAEWIKFLGLLTGRQERADSIFTAVVTEYKSLQAKTSGVKKRPKILTENMYEGVWYVPAGQSVAAQLIYDAGGYYPWAENAKIGSLMLSFEEVLDKAGDADFWIIKNYGSKFDKETLLSMDKRYSAFASIDKNGVYWSDTSTSGIFDVINFHPEVLLREYIKIFHPQLLPQYKLQYFRPL